jgi:hypothetical protein
MGAVLCLVAFLASFLLGRRSVVAGVGAVLTTGYLYGILRANFLDTFAHFHFDCAVLGLYAAQFASWSHRPGTPAERALRSWTGWLIAWVGVMFLLPMQPMLIQLVGLRGNAFMLPFLLIGGRLKEPGLSRLCLWVAGLNLVALFFATAEYFLGVPAFYPENEVTDLIYKSKDIAGATAYRIPACFPHAHGFAGTMVITVPWLMGAWMQPRQAPWRRLLLLAGMAAAFVGTFMAAARVFLVLLFVLLVIITLSGQLRLGYLIVWVMMIAGVGYLVSGEERMQRFLTLQKTDEVMTRIEGSINVTFWELMTLYPMGNGLGGGGTSVPFFLRHLIKDPVLIENEYGRIMLEQGLAGLFLWLAFLVWAFSRPTPRKSDPWRLGWRLLWYTCLGNFALSLLGTGLMVSIPLTTLLFLGVGFLCVRGTVPRPARPRRRKQATPEGEKAEHALAV